jgi:hypothetical protein
MVHGATRRRMISGAESSEAWHSPAECPLAHVVMTLPAPGALAPRNTTCQGSGRSTLGEDKDPGAELGKRNPPSRQLTRRILTRDWRCRFARPGVPPGRRVQDLEAFPSEESRVGKLDGKGEVELTPPRTASARYRRVDEILPAVVGVVASHIPVQERALRLID